MRTNRRVIVVFTLRTVAIGIRVSRARATLTEVSSAPSVMMTPLFSPRIVASSRAVRRSASSTSMPCTEATASANAADAPKNVAMSLAVRASATPGADRGRRRDRADGTAGALHDAQVLPLEEPDDLLGARLGVAPTQRVHVGVDGRRRDGHRLGEGRVDDADHGLSAPR